MTDERGELFFCEVFVEKKGIDAQGPGKNKPLACLCRRVTVTQAKRAVKRRLELNGCSGPFKDIEFAVENFMRQCSNATFMRLCMKEKDEHDQESRLSIPALEWLIVRT